MSAPQLRLVSATLHRVATRTRMPFRFGIATMTEAPHVFLHGTFEIDGRCETGVAAEGLLPKWFDKSPQKSAQQELDEMLLAIRHAVATARTLGAATAFETWRQCYAAQLAWSRSQGLPPLLAHFGVSMVERAMLDALARAHRTTLHGLLRENLVGLDLGAIHPELQGRMPAELLPERPLPVITARHTVGLTDPLTAADLPPGARVADGLPQTLEECIAFYGLRHFKIKLMGDTDTDLARLRAVAAIIQRHVGQDYAFTLDGNEQYKDFATFAALWERIRGDVGLAAFFERLIFIEQPLHRSVALDPAVARLREWRGGPPMIIDESDAEIGDLGRALALGYAGTSHKNCKGVMKGAAHRCLINDRNATGGAPHHHMSGEDLVNIGPVALLQDLAAQAALGNASVERNGHHYYRGLAAFPPAINAAMLGHHGDLYTRLEGSDGLARLDVRAGQLNVASVNAAPFGVAAPLPMDGFEAVDI